MTGHVLLTSREVATALHLSMPMVRWYTREGRLRALRWPHGRVLRYWAAGIIEPVPLVQGVLGVDGVAAVLRVHPDAVYQLARRGQIPMSRRLFGWGISSGPLLQWMEQHSDGEHDRSLLERRRPGRRPPPADRRTVLFEADLDSDLAVARVVEGGRDGG